MEPSADHARCVHAGPSATVVRPGDTLVLTFQQTLSDAEFERIRGELKSRLGGVEVAIVDGGATGCLVYRPGEEGDREPR